jgi:hypothetical protein
MLTVTPTAVLEGKSADELEVFAVIEGRKVFLPPEAKYVMQDRRGLWFYSTRKPRTSEGDWTPNKTSICCRTDGGYVRVLKTDTRVPWLETCQRTIRMVSDGSGRRPADED